jgi:hypothetical protein
LSRNLRTPPEGRSTSLVRALAGYRGWMVDRCPFDPGLQPYLITSVTFPAHRDRSRITLDRQQEVKMVRPIALRPRALAFSTQNLPPCKSSPKPDRGGWRFYESRTRSPAVRLYPRAWRQRYGTEFEALLETGGGDLRTWANVLWSALIVRYSISAISETGSSTALTPALGLRPSRACHPCQATAAAR